MYSLIRDSGSRPRVFTGRPSALAQVRTCADSMSFEDGLGFGRPSDRKLEDAAIAFAGVLPSESIPTAFVSITEASERSRKAISSGGAVIA